MNTTRKLLASAAVLFPAAMAIAPSVAHATPYAFADNQITGLTVHHRRRHAAPAHLASADDEYHATPRYSAPTGCPATTARRAVGSANTITQAYSGPGPTPPASFTPVGAGQLHRHAGGRRDRRRQRLHRRRA